MNRRTFVKRCVVAGAVGLGAGTGYARFIERHAVEVVPVEIELGLPEPLTAAVLGDIHFDPLFEVDYLEDVVARTNRLAPDLILYTGDFLSRSADRLPDLLAVLRKARAGAGSFAVLGNHDHWVGADPVAAAFTSSGIRVLRNQSVPLFGRKDWYLTGLESYWSGAPSARTSHPPRTRARLVRSLVGPTDRLAVVGPHSRGAGSSAGRRSRLPTQLGEEVPSGAVPEGRSMAVRESWDRDR
jgi:predicted MPP superfamily phosphohydrolase